MCKRVNLNSNILCMIVLYHCCLLSFSLFLWLDPEKSWRKRDSNPGSSALEADALTTRPPRRFKERERLTDWQINSEGEIRPCAGVGVSSRGLQTPPPPPPPPPPSTSLTQSSSSPLPFVIPLTNYSTDPAFILNIHLWASCCKNRGRGEGPFHFRNWGMNGAQVNSVFRVSWWCSAFPQICIPLSHSLNFELSGVTSFVDWGHRSKPPRHFIGGTSYGPCLEA